MSMPHKDINFYTAHKHVCSTVIIILHYSTNENPTVMMVQLCRFLTMVHDLVK